MRSTFLNLIWSLVKDLITFTAFRLRSDEDLAAENLFLRKQLVLYQERNIRPRQTDPATRLSMALLSHCFEWRDALVIVQPQTLIRWHRDCFRRLWHRKSTAGRKPIPVELRQLIKRMANENPLWGEQRIANEILLKCRISVSPRTVRKYMPNRKPRQPRGDQSWRTFLRNHSKDIIACDFCTVVTVNFRILYVLVIVEHATRKLLYVNVTANPTSEWTIQQIRESLPFDHLYRFMIRDGDRIFSNRFDEALETIGIQSVRTPWRSPQANGICERLIGTLRRECLDHLIPLSHRQLRRNLLDFQHYYNQSRPHLSLGPGIPDKPVGDPFEITPSHQSCLGVIRSIPHLGGLHHNYIAMAA